ncbi:MAG: hypothetical protein SXU28_07085 [Pseudomonadota bacterium]|nr:hypothetical protein [Pseudomonadota bacterium]
MRQLAILAAFAVLAGCKPPPTDEGLDRELPAEPVQFASEPLPSPDTEGAIWVRSNTAQRISYGVPGHQAVLAITCLSDSNPPRLRITRNSPADKGAGALLALVGNGAIGRLPVDATEIAEKSVWRGEVLAADSALEPLAGPRQLTATIPGAGMVTINPSTLPMQFLSACRESETLTENLSAAESAD